MVNENVGSLIISWDFSNKDEGILLVGVKPEGKPVEIINAFMGNDAKTIRDKLITRKG